MNEKKRANKKGGPTFVLTGKITPIRAPLFILKLMQNAPPYAQIKNPALTIVNYFLIPL